MSWRHKFAPEERGPRVSSIDWVRLTQPEFDRIVESLFMKEHRDIPKDAFVVNGRGGDQGIDIHIRRDGLLIIVQLKYFPEGFSGGFRDVRQAEIRESFKTALHHDPDDWWLVVPTTVTANERNYVEGLLERNAKGRTKPDIVIFDRPKLDALAAKHQELVTYFKRDELREAAKDFNAEQALLIDKADVLARVAALSKQSETLDPDWRLGFFTDGDVVGTTLIAKHPHAAEKSPVKLTLNTAFDADHEELRKSFEQAFSFGTPGRVDLPAAVVSKFVVDGPAFVAETLENVEVSFWTEKSDQDSLPVSMVFYSDRNVPVASYSGKTTWRNTGGKGASLYATFHDTVGLEMLLPFDKSEQVRVSVKVELAGSAPADVVAGVGLLEKLESAHAVAIELDGKKLARLITSGPVSPFGENRDKILTHRDIAADLVVIQNATSRHFPYPEELDYEDLVYIRCLRLLVEGQCIVLPAQREVTPRLNGKDGEHIRTLVSGEYQSLLIEMENFGRNILGHDISTWVRPASTRLRCTPWTRARCWRPWKSVRPRAFRRHCAPVTVAGSGFSCPSGTSTAPMNGCGRSVSGSTGSSTPPMSPAPLRPLSSLSLRPLALGAFVSPTVHRRAGIGPPQPVHSQCQPCASRHEGRLTARSTAVIAQDRGQVAVDWRTRREPICVRSRHGRHPARRATPGRDRTDPGQTPLRCLRRRRVSD